MTERNSNAAATFRCGHPHSKENTYKNYGYSRCKECHQAAGRRYHRPRNPHKSLWPANAPCLLAQVWK